MKVSADSGFHSKSIITAPEMLVSGDCGQG